MGSCCDSTTRDPVELLLRRIVDRALLGSLVTGAALGAACSDGGGRGRSTEPSTGADSGGFLIPVPIPPRDGGPDARMEGADAADDVSADAGAAPGPDAGADDAGADVSVVSEIPAGAYAPCLQGPGFPVRASGLSLSAPADYLAVRLATGIQGAPDDAELWTSDSFTLISERGSACATATSVACAEKVAHHPDMLEQSYCVQACDEWSLVTTRGDDIERWATPPELLALLGAIDSDDDALMLAASRGYDVMCPAPSEASTRENLRYVLATAEGRELIGVRYRSTCPIVITRVRLLVTAAGDVRELETADFANGDTGCVGRIPAGLRPTRVQTGIAGYLARCAHLEAASVYAFERLADELRSHGAPEELVQRARAAARDEVRHARTIGALARARGAEVEAVSVAAMPARAMVAIARENAVEGCVRETYGALIGAWQAARAQDPALRAAMRQIAGDEARHAQLSHDVQRWLLTQLSEADRKTVHETQRAAIAALQAESTRPHQLAEAGLPTTCEARTLLTALSETLWAA